MKPEQLYQSLKELAEQLNITVSEQNLKITGLKVKSGLCTVKGEKMFIMDKHKQVRQKVKILASCLCMMPIEDIYIVPAVREILEKHSDNKKELGL